MMNSPPNQHDNQQEHHLAALRDELQQTAYAPSTFRRVGQQQPQQQHVDPQQNLEQQIQDDESFHVDDDDTGNFSPANGDDKNYSPNPTAQNQNQPKPQQQQQQHDHPLDNIELDSDDDGFAGNTTGGGGGCGTNNNISPTATSTNRKRGGSSPPSVQNAVPITTDRNYEEEERLEQEEANMMVSNQNSPNYNTNGMMVKSNNNNNRAHPSNLANVASLATSLDDTTHGVPPDHNLGGSQTPRYGSFEGINHQNQNNTTNNQQQQQQQSENQNQNQNDIQITSGGKYTTTTSNNNSNNTSGAVARVPIPALPTSSSASPVHNNNNNNNNHSRNHSPVPLPQPISQIVNRFTTTASTASDHQEVADANEPNPPAPRPVLKRKNQINTNNNENAGPYSPTTSSSRVNFASGATAIVTIPADDDHGFVEGPPPTNNSTTKKSKKNSKIQHQNSNNKVLPSAHAFSADENDDGGNNNINHNVYTLNEHDTNPGAFHHETSFTQSRGPQNFVSLDPVGVPSNNSNATNRNNQQIAAISNASDAEILGPLLSLHGAMTTCFNGLCIIGPQLKLLIITIVMLTVPFIMLAAGIMPYLSNGLIFIDVIFYILTLVFLLKTSFSDPGVVEKRIGVVIDPDLEVPVTMFWSNKGEQNVDVVFGDDPLPKFPAKQRINALKAADEEMDEDIGINRDEEDEKRRKKQKKREEKRKRRRAEKLAQKRAEAAAKRKEERARQQGGDINGEYDENDEDEADAQIELSSDDSDNDDDQDSNNKNGANTTSNNEEEEIVNKFNMSVRYCRTCCRYKGPRTFHCDVCKACIDGYDHHCPFTGTCIGYNNYTSFLGFMFSLQLYILFAFISAVSGPVDLAHNEDVCLNTALGMMGGMPVVLVILIFGLTFGVSGLLILHVYLCFVGKTTMEHLREKYLKIPNPFDRGWKRNLIRAFGGQSQDRAAFTATYDPLIIKFERQRRIVNLNLNNNDNNHNNNNNNHN